MSMMMNPAAAMQQQMMVQNQQSMPVNSYGNANNVTFKSLPFYDVMDKLVAPTVLASKGSSRYQHTSFQFLLSLAQATEIASNRDMRPTAKISHPYQIQLRFCPLDTSKEQGDEFPPSICVEVNNKMCPLPNPIPTNKPNTEPKRPPKPTDLTPLCKLSPALSNNINIKWTADHGKAGVSLILIFEYKFFTFISNI